MIERGRLVDPNDVPRSVLDQRAGIASQRTIEERIARVERYLGKQGVEVRDEGEFAGVATTLDVAGLGVTATVKDGIATITVAAGGQGAANPDTSGATLAALETEVNQLKALLRSAGLMAP